MLLREEIKDCPFCGGFAEIETHEIDTYAHRLVVHHVYGKCVLQKVELPWICGMAFISFVEKWNERAAKTPEAQGQHTTSPILQPEEPAAT